MDSKTLATLQSYMDGELASEDRRRVESALETDVALRQTLDFMRQVERTAESESLRTAPQELTGAVMAQVRLYAPIRQQPQKQSNGALYVFLAIVAGIGGAAAYFPGASPSDGNNTLAPTIDWLTALFSRVSEALSVAGTAVSGLRLHESGTMVLALVAVLLLALMDIYLLRPFLRKNGR